MGKVYQNAVGLAEIEKTNRIFCRFGGLYGPDNQRMDVKTKTPTEHRRGWVDFTTKIK
jgi:hypothetical protein